MTILNSTPYSTDDILECHRAFFSVSHVFHFLNFLGEDKDIGADHIPEYESRENINVMGGKIRL